jgi:tetratricopeptide (TPR) repeat protein
MRSRFLRRRAAFLLAVLALVLLAPCPALCQATNPTPAATADTAETHLGKGYDALKQDRYQVAADEFRTALALDPSLTLRARFPLAVALFEMHQPDDARREFEQVRHDVGDHPNILYYLGRLDLDGRNFTGAIQNLGRAAAKPPFPDTAYYLGVAYFRQGDLANAEKWLRQAAEVNPHDARIPYQLGQVYRKQGRVAEAQKALAQSDEQRQRDDKESRLRLECRQKLDQGLTEEARAVCEQLYVPNDADKLTELGTIYAQHGDLEAALKPLRRAAELTPQSPQVQYNLALAYYQLNRYEDARAPLAESVKRWPDLFQLNALYGAVLFKMNEYQSAYPVLVHAHQLNPQDTANEDLLYLTIFQLGRKHQESREYPESIRYFEEAAKLRSQEPSPHRQLAEIYTLTNRPAQAAAEQQEADRLASNLGKVR